MLFLYQSFIGPSRINESIRLRRYINVFHSDGFLSESNSDSVRNSTSDDGLENDMGFSLNTDSSRGMGISNILSSTSIVRIYQEVQVYLMSRGALNGFSNI